MTRDSGQGMGVSRLTIEFQFSGGAEFGAKSENVTPAQLWAVAGMIRANPYRLLDGASYDQETLDNRLIATFDRPGSALVQITLLNVTLEQLYVVASWLEWRADYLHTMTAYARQAEAQQQAKLLTQLPHLRM